MVPQNLVLESQPCPCSDPTWWWSVLSQLSWLVLSLWVSQYSISIRRPCAQRVWSASFSTLYNSLLKSMNERHVDFSHWLDLRSRGVSTHRWWPWVLYCSIPSLIRLIWHSFRSSNTHVACPRFHPAWCWSLGRSSWSRCWFRCWNRWWRWCAWHSSATKALRWHGMFCFINCHFVLLLRIVNFLCIAQILILIFAEVLGLYGMRTHFESFWIFFTLSTGLIVALIMNTKSQAMLVGGCLLSFFLHHSNIRIAAVLNVEHHASHSDEVRGI